MPDECADASEQRWRVAVDECGIDFRRASSVRPQHSHCPKNEGGALGAPPFVRNGTGRPSVGRYCQVAGGIGQKATSGRKQRVYEWDGRFTSSPLKRDVRSILLRLRKKWDIEVGLSVCSWAGLCRRSLESADRRGCGRAVSPLLERCAEANEAAADAILVSLVTVEAFARPDLDRSFMFGSSTVPRLCWRPGRGV